MDFDTLNTRELNGLSDRTLRAIETIRPAAFTENGHPIETPEGKKARAHWRKLWKQLRSIEAELYRRAVNRERKINT